MDRKPTPSGRTRQELLTTRPSLVLELQARRFRECWCVAEAVVCGCIFFVELELIPYLARSYYKAVELGYLTKDPAAYQHDRDQCGCDQHGYWLWPIQSRPIQPRQTNRSRIFSLYSSFSLCSHFHLYYLLFSQFCRWALGNCAVGMYYL